MSAVAASRLALTEAVLMGRVVHEFAHWLTIAIHRMDLTLPSPPSIAPASSPYNAQPMAPKQRQIRMEQRGAFEAIQALEQRSDEELENETKYKSAAMAILGSRAAERFDAVKARSYFQRAIASARPQERMQLRRMADASTGARRASSLRPQGRGRAPRPDAAHRTSDARVARDGATDAFRCSRAHRTYSRSAA